MSVLYKKMFRDMWKSKWNLLGIILVIAFSTTIYYGLSSSTSLQKNYIENEYQTKNLAHCELNFENEGIVEANASQILEKYEEIESYELRTKTPILINLTSNISNNYITIGLAIGLERYSQTINPVNTLSLKNNNSFTVENENESIYIENNFAKNNGLEVGDFVQLNIYDQIRTFSILDLTVSPEYYIVRDPNSKFNLGYTNYGIVYISQNVLQSIIGTPNITNNIVIKFEAEYEKDDSIIHNLAIEIRNELEIINNGSIEINDRIDMLSFKEVALVFEGIESYQTSMPILMYLVSAFGIYVILSRLIRNQRQQIGVLISMGVKRKSIFMNYYSIILIIGIIGGILGSILGFFMVQFLGSFYSDSLGMPPVTPIFQPQYMLSSFAIEFIILSIGIILPLKTILKINPAEAIYKDPSIQYNSSNGIFERLNNKLHNHSIWLTMAFRNFFRNSARTISTILIIGIGVGLCIGQIAAMRLSPIEQYDNFFNWDYNFIMDGFQNENDFKADFNPIEGIDSYDYVQAQEIYSNLGENNNQSFRLLGIESNFTAFTMHFKEGDNTNLVITEAIAKQYDIEVGDNFPLTIRDFSTLDSQKKITLEVSGIIDSLPYDSMIFINKETFALHSGILKNEVNMIYISTNDQWNDKSANNLNTILSNPHIIEYYNIHEQIDIITRISGGMGNTGTIVSVLELIVMSILVANTMSINAIERTRELAILSSMGIKSKQIKTVIFTEVLLFSTMGCILALFSGHFFGTLLINATINNETNGIYQIYQADYGEIGTILLFSLALIFWIGTLIIRYCKNLKLPKILNQRLG